MITEEMLCAAAAKSQELYVANLEQGYDPNIRHDFSPQFEKKIKKLSRKAEHPVFYDTMKRIASILLAVIISGGVWLTIDVEARSAVVGWVNELYETYFAFRHDGATDTAPGSADYRPTWVPDGYSEWKVNASESKTVVIYDNGASEIIRFAFINKPDEADWFIDVSQADIKAATVNGSKADIFIAQDPEEANGIAWASGDTAFYVSGFIDTDELLLIAESVQIIK